MSIPGASFRPSKWCCIDWTSAGMLISNTAFMPTIVFTFPGVSEVWGCLKIEATKITCVPDKGYNSTRYFTNSLYPECVPLGFVTFSASDGPVTLSQVTLTLRYLSKNAVFDAKPPIFEAVTYTPHRLFFLNRPLFPPRSQILNVTASNISLSVK